MQTANQQLSKSNADNMDPRRDISTDFASNAFGKKSVITISDAAASKIKELLAARDPSPIGIRISVKSGGCSGFSYDISYADNIRQFEEVVHQKDVAVLIDPKALIYVIGAEMDYFEDQFKSGFVFNNPNEKGKCGCGKSFSV